MHRNLLVRRAVHTAVHRAVHRAVHKAVHKAVHRAVCKAAHHRVVAAHKALAAHGVVAAHGHRVEVAEAVWGPVHKEKHVDKSLALQPGDPVFHSRAVLGLHLAVKVVCPE